MQRGNDRAIREWQSTVAKGFDRWVVAKLRAQLSERASGPAQLLACQLFDRNQTPVAMAHGDSNSIDRRHLTIGLSGCGLDVSASARRGRHRDRGKCYPSHEPHLADRG